MITILTSSSRYYIQGHRHRQQQVLLTSRRLLASSSSSLSSWNVDLDTGIISSKRYPDELYQTIIGLEIHAQLDIPTKLFSPSKNISSLLQKPNTTIHPMDLGVPGFLPRLSKSAVQYAILSASALKCSIANISRFERKHYFYADLPLGYQVTQQRWPLASDGILTCRRVPPKGKKKPKKRKKKDGIDENGSSSDPDDDDDNTFTVRIERIQLEQDTGKTITTTRKVNNKNENDDSDTTTTTITESLVDFNRAGCALIEIVFHPDIRSPKDASIAVETLRNLLKYVGTCNGKMEEGSLRCDLNVSISPINNEDDTSTNTDDDDDNLVERSGNRVEVKNLSSLKNILWAAEYEAKRQASAIVLGDPTKQQTRTFDMKSKQTVLMRTKEGAEDYRFMPEPDLPPIVLNGNNEVFDGMDLQTYLETKLPELPEEARRRLTDEYELSEYLATVLTGDPPAIRMYDEAVQVALDHVKMANEEELVRTQKQRQIQLPQIAEAVANLLCNELFKLIREQELEQKNYFGDAAVDTANDDESTPYSRVNGQQLGELVALVLNGVISNNMTKQILPILFHEASEYGKSPNKVATDRGYRLITDTEELTALCQSVIAESPDEMERYKLGEKFARKITKFLVGKAMAKSGGNAHPERLNEVLLDILEKQVGGDAATS